MSKDFSEDVYSLIFTALKHPLRRKILRMLREKPMTFTEILDTLSVSTGHLNYYLTSLGEMISKNHEGKYRLSSLGVAALNLMTDVEEPPFNKGRGRTSFVKTYSIIVCVALLVLSGYFLSYEIWELPPQPPLEQFWTVQIPFRIEPNQSATVTYTIIYNRTVYAGISGPTLLEIRDRDPPANTFEVREYDIGSYNAQVVTENANFTAKVYSPSGELLNEYDGGSYDFGMLWLIQKPGTYCIVITNLNPTEPLEMKNTFQFTRNRFYRPYAKFGYVTLALGLGFPLVTLVSAFRKKLREKIGS